MLAWLTPALLNRLIPNLASRDAREILMLHESLESWARTRFFGSAWAMVRGDEVLGAGGVMSLNEDTGVLWLAGTEHWTGYAMHVVRAWRAILSMRLYKRYEAQCHVDNPAARRFVEHFAFKPIYESNGWIHYRMTPS